MKRPSDSHDALVIGAGPAGVAAATVLADRGVDVLLVDREPLERYSVGESLIPFCWDALDRLGVVDAVDQSGFVVPKHSVQFISLDGRVSKPFYFFQHTDHPRAKTWQVFRSDFDALLRRNAIEKGVTFLPETKVTELLDDDGTVRGARLRSASGEEREVQARVTVDATGRATLAQARYGWRQPDPVLKKMAVWTYFEGAKRDSGFDEGTTTIAYLNGKAWFWFIPLSENRASVGVVGDKDELFHGETDLGAIFERESAAQPWIADRLKDACRTEDYRVTSEFSYRSRHGARDGLVLAGDAFGFLDPVFSSGVYFALRSGVLCGDAIVDALAANDVSAARFEGYAREVRRQMEPMRQLVHAFYDGDFNFGTFLKRYPEERVALTDVLIGDVSRDYDEFFARLGEFAKLPTPMPVDEPRVEDSSAAARASD